MTEAELMAIVNEALLDAKAPFSRPKDPLSMKEFCLSFAERVAAAEREAWAVVEPTQKKPQRDWQGLTDEEIGSVIEASQITLKNYCSEDKQIEYARAIEDKLKEKNSGAG
jgi:hypothetical protein